EPGLPEEGAAGDRAQGERAPRRARGDARQAQARAAEPELGARVGVGGPVRPHSCSHLRLCLRVSVEARPTPVVTRSVAQVGTGSHLDRAARSQPDGNRKKSASNANETVFIARCRLKKAWAGDDNGVASRPRAGSFERLETECE